MHSKHFIIHESASHWVARRVYRGVKQTGKKFCTFLVANTGLAAMEALAPPPRLQRHIEAVSKWPSRSEKGFYSQIFGICQKLSLINKCFDSSTLYQDY